MAAQKHNPFEHVQDTQVWEFFSTLFADKQEIRLPYFDIPYFGYRFQLTKFMILELIAAVLIILIYWPMARRASSGELPKGRWWNAFESLLTFVRNEIAKPNLGEQDADKYVPYLWTLFLFLLFCNLLGMIPFMGSPTANIWVTGALALISFIMLHGAAIVKMGYESPDAHDHDHHGHDHHHGSPPHFPPHGGGTGGMAGLRTIPIVGPLLRGVILYGMAMWPRIDVPYVGWFFSLMIFAIEMLGTVIKSGVLAVRLFANMFAGHMVLSVILLFIVTAAESRSLLLLGSVSFASVLGVVGLSLLEIFVAFLQAYIFVFLTALFMGMSLHPEH